MDILLKRAYEAPSVEDGDRILIDRLWPRGISKETGGIHHWMKEVAPSHELRKWFNHDPLRWDEFRRRYREELATDAAAAEGLAKLREMASHGVITLVFSAKSEDMNNAVVLRDVLLQI